MRLTFLGATGTVTGSRYLVEAAGKKILVDCGLFQGLKELRLRNWEPFPIDPGEIDAVVLTHAHLDHSGYLPVLIRNGFRGPVYATPATRDLAAILLPDSGKIQEEDAEYANRRGFSKHRPALPLYTLVEAQASLGHFEVVEFGREVEIVPGVRIVMHRAGHILGAAMVSIRAEGRTIHFSGDLGRPEDPLLHPPEPVTAADYLVLESTYGDRLHETTAPEIVLGEVINRTSKRGGAVIIPAFAVGRTQAILYHLNRLRGQKSIPDIPIFLDSPMAVNATALLHRHPDDHRLTPAQCVAVCSTARIINTAEESKALDRRVGPMIIISASGMATGGRVIHHLKAFAPDHRNTILFAGHQAAGTRGEAMVAGAETVKIHGEDIPVRAEVLRLDGLSAHADYAEILDWLGHFERAPRRTFLTHGEPAPAAALGERITEALGWRCHVPAYREQFSMTTRSPGGSRGAGRVRATP